MCLLEGKKSVSDHRVQCLVFFVFWPRNSSALLALVNASLTTIFLPLPSPAILVGYQASALPYLAKWEGMGHRPGQWPHPIPLAKVINLKD